MTRLERESVSTKGSSFEHAVVVRVRVNETESDIEFALAHVEDQLTKALEAVPGGRLDDFEMAPDGEARVLRLRGPDPDRLFEAIRPILEKSAIIRDVVDVEKQ